ncbi:hypothetical protein ACFWBX_17035 [Streptomyces sp. NPDC059991]|uniref:hypothetical protein n=1 Tax=Streptomyces sp. NPDC059991 TaxID=3347028 RepID=UPI0036861B67
MGNELDIMQVAAGGAAVLVAEMAKSSWTSFRAAVVRFFGLGGQEVAEEDLRLIDAAQARIAECPESEREAVAEALRQQLLIQLAAFLQKRPDAAADLQALVDGAESAEEGHRVQASVQHNTATQVVISGGSVTGSVTYQAPGEDR